MVPRLGADPPGDEPLLESATVTPVVRDDRSYELLAWGPPEHRRGWLCLPPEKSPLPGRLHPDHLRLLERIGGIVEFFGEPPCWWNNQNEVLTLSAAGLSVAAVLTDYSWLWTDDGLELPVDPDDFYAVAVEANGNLTLAHRGSGAVLLFAPDHAFDGVTALAGSPPYSLMTIDAAPDLTTWIESTVDAWSTA